jgi:hypothetical protein
MPTSRGQPAWKDVSAEWLSDGGIHFVGTVYFNRVEDMTNDQKQMPGPALFSFDRQQ